jgi:hypothetical protein
MQVNPGRVSPLRQSRRGLDSGDQLGPATKRAKSTEESNANNDNSTETLLKYELENATVSAAVAAAIQQQHHQQRQQHQQQQQQGEQAQGARADEINIDNALLHHGKSNAGQANDSENANTDEQPDVMDSYAELERLRNNSYAHVAQAAQEQLQHVQASTSQHPAVQGSPDSQNSGHPITPISYGEGKPQVGSDEWHKLRRDNHKEVERKRRETINQGINRIASVVPGAEKQKGQILDRAYQYIVKLQDMEKHNNEIYKMELIQKEQTISELVNSNKRLKTELSEAWKEIEFLKKEAQRKSS